MRGLCLSSFEEIDPEVAVIVFVGVISHWNLGGMILLGLMGYSPSIFCLRARSRLRLIPSSSYPYLISTVSLDILLDFVLSMQR